MQFLSIHRGVYAVGRRRLTLEGRWMAAVLAGGASTALSHRSAGQLWRILPRTGAWPEIARPRAARRRAGIVVHRAVIPWDEITVIDNIPATGPSRTVLDLSARSSRAQVEQMLNEAEVRGLIDRVSVPALLERYPRRAGSVMLREIFSEQSHTRGITKKELERRFRVLLDSTDLPRPRRNAHIAVGGRFFEVDCLWAEQRLIVELDGRAVHGTPLAFEHDRERDRLLVADGWRVVRITWRQLRDDASAVIADLRLMLARQPSRPPTL
jgi:very-short-patch-repair endonuclease